eukprot:CAMPEP_0177592368 /NCGR_PEP_ID=MMETSP0419_2-20121207/8520_1 /TAXON_ID=582737 /ORGANISM="Tetraselmis sp., Strain GSL018" /LENGTH=354 /DNA_ID=CAMNT_0019083225 /DNA_START=24 /DNA_END=1085 /DNA_ORIENTATION=-
MNCFSSIPASNSCATFIAPEKPPFQRLRSSHKSPGLTPRARTAVMQFASSKTNWIPKLIASDVDGTLLNSSQQLSPCVRDSIRKASEAGVPLVVATGKARGPWTEAVLPQLGEPTPGVYLQGCLIYDEQGKLLYSRDLEADICRDVVAFARREGLTLTAYCGERILCEEVNDQTDRLLFYKEPTPEGVGPLESILGEVPVQKMIFMAEQERIDEIRPLAEKLLAGRASLTTALTGMLEVLPLGASKGEGVRMLLERLQVDPEDVLGMGDGENDIEMLKLVGLGVAMGNGKQIVKEVADAVAPSNDDDGVAWAIEQYVLEPLERRVSRAEAEAALDPPPPAATTAFETLPQFRLG